MRGTCIAAISTLAIGLAPVSARAGDEDGCEFSSAPIVSTYFPVDQGCMSPVGICTQGTIPSGPLAGTTVFTVLTVDPGDPPSLRLYTGELLISTLGGDVIIHDSGTFDTLGLTFSEIDPIVSATGSLSLTTGVLFSNGTQTLDDTQTPTGFEGVIFGDLCTQPGDTPPAD